MSATWREVGEDITDISLVYNEHDHDDDYDRSPDVGDEESVSDFRWSWSLTSSRLLTFERAVVSYDKSAIVYSSTSGTILPCSTGFHPIPIGHVHLPSLR